MGSSKKPQQENQESNSGILQGPIIVGAGPSGLAAAACLSNNGVPSLILEKSDCIASLWQQKTYDRLKLHLPKQFCELPLMGFPEDFPRYPTKSQFISYMQSYASYFSIKPKFNQAVQTAEFNSVSGFWRVKTQDYEYISKWLIVATGENAELVVPEIVRMDKFQGPVLHTSLYKSGSDFRNQRVLVVGCGNSGMERFMNGQEKEFDSIILATGYKSNVPTWLKDHEFDCIRNLQRDGVEPLLNASTTIIVKHGDVLDLLTASQIDWMKSWKVKIKKQADVQGHGHGQGGPMAIGGGGGEVGVGTPGAGFAQGEGRGRGGRRGGRDGGGRQPGPRRRPIVHGHRRGNNIDLMKEYHEAVAASLRYILTLSLQEYVSVEDMISHIRRVVDVHGNQALTVLHQITFVMRQNGQKVRWTVEQARTAVWDDFRRTFQSVEVVFRVAGMVEVNIHGHVRQLARREIPTLTELVNRIRLWGAVDGDRERFKVQIAGQVKYYDSYEIETYSHRVGWGRVVIALRGVLVSR